MYHGCLSCSRSMLATYTHTHTNSLLDHPFISLIVIHGFFCAAAECFHRMFHQNSIEHRGRFNDNRCPLLKASKNSLKRLKENLIDLLSMLSMQFRSPYIQALIPIDTKKNLFINSLYLYDVQSKEFICIWFDPSKNDRFQKKRLIDLSNGWKSA